MTTPLTQQEKIQRGADDSGRYFRHMMEFVGFTPADAQAIQKTALIIEKHIPAIVAGFYANLLRYPPTRKYFLKKDGNIDQDYLQKRMHHLSSFWRRTASGVYDDEYARYVDYVGRAHTSHGADPSIYIAERYVIGQVGFIQHAISAAITQELHEYNEDLERQAIRAWNMLMMVILEMLSRAYGVEREAENYEGVQPVDNKAVQRLAIDAYERGLGLIPPTRFKEVFVAKWTEIPDGERKIVEVNGISIGVFHHNGGWYAVQNHCLHRGGPVATGCLEGDTLVCPWHGFRFNVTNGQLLVDPGMKLDTYDVLVNGEDVFLRVPDLFANSAETVEEIEAEEEFADLKEDEFPVSEVGPGQLWQVVVGGEKVAVYNVDGRYYATQDACSHVGAPLSIGKLQGTVVTCPAHGSCFDVTNGEVRCGPATRGLKTFTVQVQGEIGRVMPAV